MAGVCFRFLTVSLPPYSHFQIDSVSRSNQPPFPSWRRIAVQLTIIPYRKDTGFSSQPPILPRMLQPFRPCRSRGQLTFLGTLSNYCWGAPIGRIKKRFTAYLLSTWSTPTRKTVPGHNHRNRTCFVAALTRNMVARDFPEKFRPFQGNTRRVTVIRRHSHWRCLLLYERYNNEPT